jgi:hypothetical protein
MDSDPDADPDPFILIMDLQDANKTLIKTKSFSAYYFLKVLYIILKRSHKTVEIKVFLTIFA